MSLNDHDNFDLNPLLLLNMFMLRAGNSDQKIG